METLSPNNSLKKDIRSALNGAGLKGVSNDIISKCAAIASTLHMSPDQMATCWEAYSLTKGVDELTPHTFEAYKTEVYKQSNKVPEITGDGALLSRTVKRQPPANMVTPPDVKRRKPETLSTYSAADTARSTPSVRAPLLSLPKYHERPKAGQVVTRFNPNGMPAISNKSSDSGDIRCSIDTSDFDATSNVTEPYRFMFSAISDRAHALEQQLQKMAQKIVDQYGINDGENGIAPLEQVNVARQDMVCCVGRICNEAHEGKLNATSVVLEGSSVTAGGARVAVDLSHLQAEKIPYSLFPGQIVAIQGMNPTGRKLIAHRIFEGASPTPCTTSIGDLRTFHYEKQNGMPLKVIAACGPFATSDSPLSYQPFEDLLCAIIKQAPDVAIIMGPFVDVRQPLANEGRTTLDSGEEQIFTHEALFSFEISSRIEQAMKKNLTTQFILMPAMEDATAKCVYPQPPLEDRLQKPVELQLKNAKIDHVIGTMGLNELNAGRKQPRVHCLSNPSTFRINEVVFGITSTDVLFHMSTEETNSNLEPGSRLRRIAQHMLQQQSYYPLFPPPTALPMNLELTRMGKFGVPCLPDVFLVPSKLSPFATPLLESAVVVNPGHLTKGTTGGTYAIMEIQPFKRETLEESGGDDVHLRNSVQSRINVEVRRI